MYQGVTGVDAPPCGVRFGDALLGRGHGRDLDSNTEYGEYPWHAGLLVTIDGVTEYVCGGAVIDSRHVATAAHCVKSYYPEEIHVRLGDWDVNTDLEPYQHVDMPVSRNNQPIRTQYFMTIYQSQLNIYIN